MSETKNKKTYSSHQIQILKGLEAVRKRPGMYIGDVGSSGLHHLVWEIIDNAIDEVTAGFANEIDLIIKADNTVIVKDNGRGIPVDKHPKSNLSGVETVFTTLHAGGKFDNETYKVSGGLHGVGASVVNALSSLLKVWVYNNYNEYYIEFKNGGKPVDKLKKIREKTDIKSGTIVEFVPDFTIIECEQFDDEIIKERLHWLSHLNKKLKIKYTNEQINKTYNFYSAGGIKEWVEQINAKKEHLNNEVIYYYKPETKLKSINAKKKHEEYKVTLEVAFQYNVAKDSQILSFCNNIRTTEGGSHEEGFKNALLRVITKFAKQNKLLKNETLNKSDVIANITAIISVLHSSPQFEAQTKRRITNSELRMFVVNNVGEIFEKYMLENPKEADLIVNRCINEMRLRNKQELYASTIENKRSIFESNSLPGKLAVCTSNNPEISELYIVEGDSAGGSAKLGRDRYYQAILPLRGKVINAQKSNFDKLMQNQEIENLITAIGVGILNGKDFNIEKLRYNKIIIMTDADVDGSHIRMLLLTFFCKYMTPLVQNGNIFIAQPPLYKFSYGKTHKYLYDDKSLEAFKKNTTGKYQIQRYKGLGEMNPEQLWDTTMNPLNRSLIKISLDNVKKVESTIDLFMGNDPEPRREYIQANAKFVKNLDI